MGTAVEVSDTPRGSRGNPPAAEVTDGAAPTRLRALVDAHHLFLWRAVRRMGVPAAQVDDAVQEVFCVAHRRLADIRQDRERAFLFAVAVNIASDMRRKAARSRERLDETAIDVAASAYPGPEEMLDQRRARAQLDDVLDALADDVRAVFVLVEMEGMTLPEVAALLEIPLGTVTSRLRRGREQFHAVAARLRARAGFDGGRS
jgi:RNA polymerase sigma-70 factor (ECF subfamily)